MGDALTDIREAGQVPWTWIVDETRSLDERLPRPAYRQTLIWRGPPVRQNNSGASAI
jgi:hypothetical protein